MKIKFLIFICLALQIIPSMSFADWKFVDTNIDGDTYYIDPITIKKKDNYRYYMQLDNYKAPGQYGVMSVVSYRQSDCNTLQFKYLSDGYYDEPMAKGKLLHQNNIADDDWTVVPQNSVFATIIKYACNFN